MMIQEELRRVRAEREKLEDKLAEAEIKKAGLEELRKAIKVGTRGVCCGQIKGTGCSTIKSR